MIIKNFRGEDFINRDKEIEFFLDYFNTNPKRVLWVYGPKSTGKTTLIEYIIENYLFAKRAYSIKYINFRRTLVGSFNNFIESILEEKDENETQTELNRSYNLFGLFKLEARTLKKIKENKKNLFNYLLEEFQKEQRKNIFIIDEIQSLQDIYINGDKLLLNEFLNFCAALTKETHLSHVLILTSNTIFLNEIYNNAKMKVTSSFKLIDHLSYQDIKTWLSTKKLFTLEEIAFIYKYLGGSVAHIKKLIDEYKYYSSLKEYLEEMVEITENEIDFFIQKNKLSNKDVEKFKFVIKKIISNGYFDNKKYKGYIDLVSQFAEAEILFYDPVKNITTANSKIYAVAFEKMVNRA